MREQAECNISREERPGVLGVGKGILLGWLARLCWERGRKTSTLWEIMPGRGWGAVEEPEAGHREGQRWSELS